MGSNVLQYFAKAIGSNHRIGAVAGKHLHLARAFAGNHLIAARAQVRPLDARAAHRLPTALEVRRSLPFVSRPPHAPLLPARFLMQCGGGSNVVASEKTVGTSK